FAFLHQYVRSSSFASHDRRSYGAQYKARNGVDSGKAIFIAPTLQYCRINGDGVDTELARTFLTIVAAGSFAGAADRLNVTASTVSSRIAQLEEQLRCRLFVRNKAGATLTAAGRQFQKHASMLVRTVAQARQDVGVPRGFESAL